MENLMLNFKELEKEIENLDDDYEKIEKCLENYLILNKTEDLKSDAYNHVLKTCEQLNKSDEYNDKNIEDLIEKLLKFKLNEKEKFINSFYKRLLNAPTETEIQVFWLMKNNKREEFIKLVELNRSIRIEVQHNDSSLLVHAVKFQKLDIIKFLIQNKANIRAVDNYGRNIIQIASLICNDDVLNYLIEAEFLEINQNKNLNNMLTNQNINEINLEYIDDFSASILHYIGARGRMDLIELFEVKLNNLEKSIYFIEDKAGLTCFDRATKNCSNLETLKFLIKKSEIEMDYSNSKIRSIILWAFYNCSIKIVEWLLLNVKSIPRDILNKDSLLHEVKLEADDSIVKSFVEYFLNESNLLHLKLDGFDINSRNIGGNTLMMELAGGYYRALSINLADFLIQKGADLKIKNYQDQNIIHIAAAAGNLELLKYLNNTKEISWGGVDKIGNTALILAVENGYFNVTKYLVLNKNTSIPFEKTNIYGFNAFDVALSKGFHDIARFLSGSFVISNIPRLISNLSKFFESFSCKNFLLHPLVIKTSEELKNKIFIVRGKDRGKAAWHYVDVEPWSIQSLKTQPHGSNIDVTNFGKILKSGWGDTASKEAKLGVELIEEQRDYFNKFKNSILKNNIYMIERSGLNDFKDYYGANLLHISSAYGRLDLILWLYLNKFDIKATDNCGNTALYYAALNYQYDTIVLLKLLGLNKLYFGQCKFLSGHIENYLINTNLSFHPNILVASLLQGIKAANKFIVKIEDTEKAQRVFSKYFENFNINPHFELMFRSNLR